MTRILDLIADTRRMAYGSMADQLNFLAEEAPLGQAQLKMMLDVGGIAPGMILSSGLNVYYVQTVNSNDNTVTVYATYDNSKADALPVGSPVMIRPRVTDWHLFNLLNKEIVRLSSAQSGLFREASWTAEFDGWDNTFTIPTIALDMTSLLRVQVKSDQARVDDTWFPVPPNSVRWQPENGVVRVTSPDRLNTYMRGGFGAAFGGFSQGQVKFDYRAPFVPAVALTDDVVVDCGLADTMTDIPPLGAVVTLLRTTESRRMNIHAQGDPRRPGEVPPSGNSGAARELEREYRQRIDDEWARLLNRNPIVRHV